MLKGVPFNLAARVGQKYTDRFWRWDKTKKGKNDPSFCRGLYQLPSGVLFWESKMAVDADGSPTKSVLKSSSGSSGETSYSFPGYIGEQWDNVKYFTHGFRHRCY
jgi:hypothetical protein